MALETRSPITDNEWEDYYSLRYRILRQPLGQPLGSEKNEGDIHGIHLALYENELLRAIARIDATEDRLTKQIRFVAVEQEQQGKGLGRKIMLDVESECLQQGANKIILQARENAVHFYQELGYELKEKTHLLFGQVQHYLMEKHLN